MRRFLLVGVVLATFAFAGTANAASPNSNGADHYSFVGASGDGGSCGNTWANDTYTLDVTIRSMGGAAYAVKVMYKNGSFKTIAGQSPGACSTVPNHGSLVIGGIVGSLEGQLDETVTSATYNPNGCNSNTTCTSRSGVIAALFGAGAGEANFSYNFEYNSNYKSLAYHHWQDKSDPQGGSDKFTGDIANS